MKIQKINHPSRLTTKCVNFFLIFIQLVGVSNAQNQDSILTTIPKDATTVKVIGVEYKALCLALLDNNYIFEFRDADLQTFKTTLRDFKKYWNCSYSIEGRVKDSVAYLKFRLKDSPLLFKYAKWQRTKSKYAEKSLYNYPFIEVIEVCKNLTNRFEFFKENLE